jgi:hypothetical protein
VCFTTKVCGLSVTNQLTDITGREQKTQSIRVTPRRRAGELSDDVEQLLP